MDAQQHPEATGGVELSRPAAHTPADPTMADPAPAAPRRQPGEPHPYMLQRNPPNLWILVALTVLSLAVTFLVLALTVVL